MNLNLGVCTLVLLLVLAATGLYIHLWNRGAEPEIRLGPGPARREYVRNALFTAFFCFLNRLLPALFGPRGNR